MQKSVCKQHFFGYQNTKGVTLIDKVQLGLSQLCKHKFKYNFQNLSVSFVVAANSLNHFSFSCHNYTEERPFLLNKIRNINLKILESTDSRIRKTLQ